MAGLGASGHRCARDDVAATLAALPDTAHRTARVSYYRHNMQARRGVRQHRNLNRSWKPRFPLLVVTGTKSDGALDAALHSDDAGGRQSRSVR